MTTVTNGLARSNNFDAIRLLAALTVLVGHAWSLTGRSPSPSLAGVPAFTVAVWVFFTLSGYLIASSWIGKPRALSYLGRRAARIFPALAVVVSLTTFLVGPLATTLSVNHYFSSRLTWFYLTNVSLIANYRLPGVFDHLPRPVVNGSLWTLGPEFCCYLVTMLIGLSTRNTSSGPIVRAMIFALVGVGLAIATLSISDPSGSWRPAAQAAVFFMAGAVVAQAPKNWRVPLAPALVLALFWIVAGSLLSGTGAIVAWVALPLVALAVGQRSTPLVRRVGRFGDFSYGTYLWGFVLEQSIEQAWPSLALPAFVAIAVAATLLVAFASWKLVESPALRFVRHMQARHEEATAMAGAG